MQLVRTHDDFRRLWLAQTISQIGSQISYLAVPLTAAVTLDATPLQMGLLTATGAIPSLVAGLLAGALVDRHARRPVLVTADLIRAVLLGIIPLAWWLDALALPLLLMVAFAGGLCSLFFDLAYQAFVPTILRHEQLVEGNSSLELSRSAAEITGPALAGGLIQLLKAPLALTLDACSFLISALLITRIRVTEEIHQVSEKSASLWSEGIEGAREISRRPAVKALAFVAVGIGMFNAMIEAVVILYLTRTVGMEPGVLGIVFAAGSIGFVVGAMLPATFARTLGVGPTMTIAIFVIGLSDLAIPLVGTNIVIVSLVVAISQFFFGLGVTVFNVTRRTLLQTLVPNRLMGRVGGAMRVMGTGMVPVGAVVGGVLGTLLGLQLTLLAGAALETSIGVWIWQSSLWSVGDISVSPDDN